MFIWICLLIVASCVAEQCGDICTNENAKGFNSNLPQELDTLYIENDPKIAGKYVYHIKSKVLRPYQITNWRMDMFVLQIEQDKCAGRDDLNVDRKVHSVIETYIGENCSCPIINSSAELELMFGGCYQLFFSGTNVGGDEVYNVYKVSFLKWIENSYDLDYFTSKKPLVEFLANGNNLTILCWLGNMTVHESYDAKMVLFDPEEVELNVTCAKPRTTAKGQPTLTCHFLDALPGRHYQFQFWYFSPWATSGGFYPDLSKFQRDYIHSTSELKEKMQPSLLEHRWLVGMSVLAALAVLMLATSCCYLHRHRAMEKTKLMLSWKSRYTNVKCQEVQRDACVGILLVYARDCAPFMEAMRLLRRLLEERCNVQVWDLWDVRTRSAVAPAPAEWAQKAVAAPGVRVLLVETPCAAALYDATLQDTLGAQNFMKLREPLLNSRVMYRTPRSEDSLLLYLLRLVRDNACSPCAYRKYFLAQMEEFCAEFLPHVTPFTRYSLPATLPLLLQDMSGPFPGAPPTASPTATPTFHQFCDAIAKLQEFVKSNPNYLRSELLLK